MQRLGRSISNGGAVLSTLSTEFLETVKAAKSVVVGSHLNPDGDALGSALAVSHFLDTLGIQNEVLSHHPAPRNLQFLPGVERISQTPKSKDHDLAIVVDLDAIDRLGTVGPYFEKAPKMIVIDHHVPHVKPGDLRIIDPSAPATALILTRIFLEIGAEITPEMATCLLTGIVTDTGSYKFRNTNPEALSLSAVLLEKGGDINLVAEEIFQSVPLSATRLYGLVLNHLEIACNDRLAWATLTLDDFASTGSSDEDTEGFANELLSIETVQIAALFRETRKDIVRVSLRSRRGYDVAEVARFFGGGGHKNAAGCNFEMPIHDAAAQVVEKLKECLAFS